MQFKVNFMAVRRMIAQKILPARQIVKCARRIEPAHLELRVVRRQTRRVHEELRSPSALPSIQNESIYRFCSRGGMKRVGLLAILLFLSAAVLAQDQTRPVKVPLLPNRGLGTPITPYADRPPDITLVPHGPDARRGQIWVQNVGDGLLIVGQLDGDPPDFPRNKNLVLERDHVEIWLADAKDPELPPIGW
jgi:hypothetical protein